MTTLGTQIAERLREEILDGVFPAGTPLREAALAEQYGVSRRTIRDALVVLGEQGFATYRLNVGSVVRTFDEADIVDLYRTRRMLECEGARRAMDAPAAALGVVQAAFDHLKAESDRQPGSVGIARADMAFHGSIIALAGSPLCDDFYARIGMQMTYAISILQRKVHPEPAGAAVNVAEHRAICAAIVNRDAYEAQRLILEHTEIYQRTLLSIMTAD